MTAFDAMSDIAQLPWTGFCAHLAIKPVLFARKCEPRMFHALVPKMQQPFTGFRQLRAVGSVPQEGFGLAHALCDRRINYKHNAYFLTRRYVS
jgi:hypothetical protein